MKESPFRTAEEIGARRAIHEAIGRFAVAFELAFGELRAACRLMLERSGLKNQSLADFLFARAGAAELTELAGAMYKEFRSGDLEGAAALEHILKRFDKLREERNRLLHAAWTLGIPNAQGTIEHAAWALTFKRSRKKGRTIGEVVRRVADFDDLTTEATKLQIYAGRLCRSVNQSNLPLAAQLKRST
jgi:hypothetical protein